MLPVYQTIFGSNGNCYEACIASILEIKLENVPNFRTFDNNRYDNWTGEISRWLKKYNTEICFINGYDKTFESCQALPLGYSILSLRVLDGSIHAVVCLDGKVIHDPSPRPFFSNLSEVLIWTVFRRINDSKV